MVPSAPLSPVEEVGAVLEDLSDQLVELPDELRIPLQRNLQRLNDLIQPKPQPRFPEIDRRQNRAMTGLFFDNMHEAGLVFEVSRDETGSIQDWTYQEINNACLQMLGLEREQIIGKTARAVFGDDFVKRLIPEIKHIFATGEPVHYEERFGNAYYLVTLFMVDKNTVARIALDITERKQSENEICFINEALARSEANYRELADSITDPFAAYDADLRVTYQNKATEDITQISSEQAVGKTFGEVYPHLIRSDIHQLYLRALETHAPQNIVSTMVRPGDGRVFHFDLSAYPSGEGVVSLAKDITERKMAESLNQASNEINQIIHSTLDVEEIMQRSVTAGARALQSDSAALSLRKDGRWVISTVYGMSEDTLGMAMDETQELHALLAIQTQKPVAVNDAYHDERFNREHLRACGIRSVLVVPVLLRSEAMGVIFFNYQRSVFDFHAAHIDFGVKIAASLSLALENARLYQNLKDEINRRAQVEATLRDSEARERVRVAELEMLMDAVPAVIWVARDPDCQEINGNRRSYELLNMLPGENISKSSPDCELANGHYQFMKDGRVIPPEELPMQITAATAKPARDYTLDLVFQDGTSYQMIGNVNPLFNQAGKPAGAIGAFVDITRQLQLEKQQLEYRTQMDIHHRLMEQREKDRQSIARDIHDGPVQTLSSTLFNIQFAKEVVTDPQFRVEIEQIALNVKAAVQELRQVIYELRPPSVIRFGLAQAIHFHAEDFREKNSELQLVLQLADDDVFLSEMMCLTLYRIYQEAITNIIRHAQATRAWVRFRLNAEDLVLEIRDNGIGFTIGKDFGSFTEHGHFGLAGIKERVEVINGTLKITSAPGKGTTIQVKAPILRRI